MNEKVRGLVCGVPNFKYTISIFISIVQEGMEVHFFLQEITNIVAV